MFPNWVQDEGGLVSHRGGSRADCIDAAEALSEEIEVGAKRLA